MSKILLIEDDPVLLDMFKHKFITEGFEVHVTSSGREGVALLHQLQPDIVLLDLILPDITGFSVLDLVQNDPSINQIPIIVMTNIYADGEDLVKNHGVRSFFQKTNTTPNQVSDKIKSILGQSS